MKKRNKGSGQETVTSDHIDRSLPTGHQPLSSVDYSHMIRQVWFCAYIHFGTDPKIAAERAGYPKNLVNEPGFVEKLLEDARQNGHLAMSEITSRQLLQLQIHPSILKLAYLREHARSETVQMSCSFGLLDRAAVTKENAEVGELSEEIIAREFESWTKQERQAYMDQRELPERLRAKLRVARGLVPPPSSGQWAVGSEQTADHQPLATDPFVLTDEDETRVTLVEDAEVEELEQFSEEEPEAELPETGGIGALAG